jgi:hypothetical protein
VTAATQHLLGHLEIRLRPDRVAPAAEQQPTPART